MRSRDLLSVIAVLVATSATTACSSRSDSAQSMAPQGNDSYSAKYGESPPAPLTPGTTNVSSTTTAAPGATTATESYPAARNSSAPVYPASRTTTTSSNGRNYSQGVPSPSSLPASSPYAGQSVSQATTQSSGEYGYAPVNVPANQTAVPYNEAQNYGAPPVANTPYPGGGGGYAGDGDRHVRVNVPFVHLNVDKDTGGVHLDAPFCSHQQTKSVRLFPGFNSR